MIRLNKNFFSIEKNLKLKPRFNTFLKSFLLYEKKVYKLKLFKKRILIMFY